MALLALGLLASGLMKLDSGPLLANKPSSAAKTPTVNKPQVVENYGKLPLSFEANQGQSDSQVDFLSRGSGYTLFLTPTEAVLALRKPVASNKPRGDNALPPNAEAEQAPAIPPAVVRMKLVGANPSPRVSGLDELPGKSNYFLGNDPDKWCTDVPHYAKVSYKDVYPGVDLVYYGNQRQLEYDPVVGPGADPAAIALSFDGVERLRIDAQGDLVLDTADGEIRQHKPLVYQEVDDVRREIPGAYVLSGERQVGFEVAAYDSSQPLIIDPVLAYSTYLGGSDGDRGEDIAVDSSGNAYVTGRTFSTDFPTVNPFQAALGGTSGDVDVFVTKLNAAGNTVVYSTYLGGSDEDFGPDIAVDSSGNAYVTSRTKSTDFPTANPFQATHGGGGLDGFVAKLNPSGSAWVYATYLGGISSDEPTDIAADASGNAYVTGETASTNFPTANPIQGTKALGDDVFVTKFNPAGSALVYSTYLGGNGTPDTGFAIAVDASGNAYVTGETNSTDFPTVNPFQSTLLGGRDAFIAKIRPDISVPTCTYSISPTSESFPASGGTGSVLVSTRCGWNAKSDVSWITITSAASGGGTGRVEYSVEANPDTGSRMGTLTITGGQILTVTQAGMVEVPPALIVTPTLGFFGTVGDSPARQGFQIGSDGEPVNWTATVRLLNGSGWLTVSPSSGAASLAQPAVVIATVNYGALGGAGVFQAVITVTDTATGSSVTVQVTAVLSAPVARLSLSQTSFTFQGTSGWPPPPQSLTVFNQGAGTLNWSLSGLPSWLTASPPSGTAGAGSSSLVTLTANLTGQATGVFQALVTASAPGASGDPQLVSVTLNVVSTSTAPLADLSPNGMLFVAEDGVTIQQAGTVPGAQELTVNNTGGGTLTADFVAATSSGGEWLMVSPPSGTASGGAVPDAGFGKSCGAGAGRLPGHC